MLPGEPEEVETRHGGDAAAALSTADGLLLAIANALSHDIYYKMIDPNAATIRRLTVARVLLFFVAVASAALAATKPGDILAMVGWAFSLAMAGNFPVLVMGIWWIALRHQRDRVVNVVVPLAALLVLLDPVLPFPVAVSALILALVVVVLVVRAPDEAPAASTSSGSSRSTRTCCAA